MTAGTCNGKDSDNCNVNGDDSCNGKGNCSGNDNGSDNCNGKGSGNDKADSSATLRNDTKGAPTE
jgi:hypothetical protein